MAKKQIVSFCYRLVYVILSGTGLAIWLGLTQGEFYFSDLIYFTTITNVLCFLFFILYCVIGLKDIMQHKTKETTNPFPKIKGALMLGILITGILFALLPRPEHTSFASIILHFICPPMFFLDYLLFDKKGQIRKRDCFQWLLLPLLYAGFAVVRGKYGGEIGSTGSHYPYPFLDPTPSGVGSQIWIYIIVLVIAFLIFSLLIYVMDFLLRKFELKRKTGSQK